MRINNKYLRNCAFRQKAWNSIRSKEHPFEYCHWGIYEEQVNSNFNWITEQARAIDKGTHRGMFHAPKSYRQFIKSERKGQEKQVMDCIRQGDYDAEFPKWKRDADWLYF